MNCASDHKPKILRLDVSKLNLGSDSANDSAWHQAAIYIVQNFRDDGPQAWTTAFHEGGHALDYSYRQDILWYGAAYGYVETHSMMMERFFEDVDYLVEIGKDSNGKKLSRELALKYIQNNKINALCETRRQVANALYDILLWKYSYTDTSERFVDRAIKLFGEIQDKAALAKGFTIDGVDWRASSFSTNHFYSASVRYFGYIVADMAAQLSADYLWEHFKSATGRATFLNQPTMAGLLRKGYYENGFLTAFPQSIEKFTGKSFSPEQYVNSMMVAVESL
jgi:Zn-dependent oligopeptidase